MLGLLGLPGGSEWIIILIVALVIFGPRLPKVMRALGRSIVEFKKGVKGIEDDVERESEPDEPEKPPSDVVG